MIKQNVQYYYIITFNILYYTLVTIQTFLMSKGDFKKLDNVGLTNFQTQLLFVTIWLVCFEKKKADADLRRSFEQRQRET